MSPSLLFLAALTGLTAQAPDQPPPSGPPIGRVMAAINFVRVHHGTASELAGQALPLHDGDRLEVPLDGAAKVFLDDGHTIYFGPGSIAILGGPAGHRQLALERGQARAIVEGGSRLDVLTRTARATLDRGIVRVEAVDAGTRFWAESGAVRLVGTSEATEPIAEGEEVYVAAEPGAEALPLGVGRASDWNVPVEALQMAGAAIASRRLKGSSVDRVNQAVVLAYHQDPATATTAAPPDTEAPAPDQDPGALQQPELPEPELPEPEAPAEDEDDRLPRPLPSPTRTPGTADVARAAPAVEAPASSQPQAYEPIALAQPNTGTGSSAVNLALGSISGSSFAGASGALFSDAQQQTLNPVFPGNIHLVTAQTRYTLGEVKLRPSDNFPTTRQYFSIGQGPLPTSQVLTTFRTGSDPIPQTIHIPRTDNYLIQFPQSQYGVPDPANGGISTTAQGIAGLLGPVPVAPQVSGATPLRDPRAQFNDRATFALGELALQRSGRNPQIDVRRSDQDRQIIKSNDFNDLNDPVTPNRDVTFVDAPDTQFFPNTPTVKKPVAFAPPPTYRRLDNLRRAAVTTLLADRLSTYARRTGQTRFVLDGQVVDISGYQGGVGLRGVGPRASLDRLSAVRADRLQHLSMMRGGLYRSRMGAGHLGGSGSAGRHP